MFRRAGSEEGLPIRVLYKRGPFGKSTLEGWAKGVQMPAWAIGALGAAGVPDHLLSLVLDPYAKHVGTNEEDEADYDDAALAASEVAGAVQRARHPRSPGGIAIVHTEKAEIGPIARRACSKLRAVAA